ncbi:MAG: hypothetical protein KGN02_08160 [bacterium]|nr:hypothetical protein [bacterium]
MAVASRVHKNGSLVKKDSATKKIQQAEKRYTASIAPANRGFVDPGFAAALRAVETAIGRPLWLLVQDDETEGPFAQFNEIGPRVADAFFNARADLESGTSPVLLIHSSGGFGKDAYRIARLFQKQCDGFTAIVPRRAKSAATLLALGAQGIILGPYAELGPLDAQMVDYDREIRMSALDEVKALERLHASSLEAVDQLVIALIARTQKKLDTLLPVALNFVAETVKPLVEKIDTIHFTQMSRTLKEAEEYAKRLLYLNYQKARADTIANQLVETYPTHGFMIDFEEARRLGIKVSEPKDGLAEALNALIPHIRGTVIGRLEEVQDDD